METYNINDEYSFIVQNHPQNPRTPENKQKEDYFIYPQEKQGITSILFNSYSL